MYFSEPTTTLTDLLLTAAALYFAAVLFKAARPKSIPLRLWGIGFTAAAAAALVGTIYHGFRPELGDAAIAFMRNFVVFAAGTAGGLMISGVIAAPHPFSTRSTNRLRAGLAVSLVGFAVQQTSLEIGAGFNHNDIFHCLQLLAMYFFFRAARWLEDAG